MFMFEFGTTMPGYFSFFYQIFSGPSNMGTFNIKNTDINKQYIKEGNISLSDNRNKKDKTKM